MNHDNNDLNKLTHPSSSFGSLLGVRVGMIHWYRVMYPKGVITQVVRNIDNGVVWSNPPKVFKCIVDEKECNDCCECEYNRGCDCGDCGVCESEREQREMDEQDKRERELYFLYIWTVQDNHVLAYRLHCRDNSERWDTDNSLVASEEIPF